mmetsp:Transcript_40464/g.131026  ORF Transcript_40464/g.131026 Transcript_40464/m.131026 type:complete len:302 (+) Transcript_40464:731-1636(+)
MKATALTDWTMESEERARAGAGSSPETSMQISDAHHSSIITTPADNDSCEAQPPPPHRSRAITAHARQAEPQKVEQPRNRRPARPGPRERSSQRRAAGGEQEEQEADAVGDGLREGRAAQAEPTGEEGEEAGVERGGEARGEGLHSDDAMALEPRLERPQQRPAPEAREKKLRILARESGQLAVLADRPHQRSKEEEEERERHCREAVHHHRVMQPERSPPLLAGAHCLRDERDRGRREANKDGERDGVCGGLGQRSRRKRLLAKPTDEGDGDDSHGPAEDSGESDRKADAELGTDLLPEA